MKAYVLAAGYGTRMYPVTRDTPKALLEVAGVSILSHIVRRLCELEDLTEIVVVTNDRFAAQFEAWRDAQEPRSVPIVVLNDGTTSDENRLGAVADLAFAAKMVPSGPEDVVVVAGDNLFDFDLREIHEAFRDRRLPTLLVRRVEEHTQPSRYNEVTMDSNGRVTLFREKPANPETDLTAIALYFLPAATMNLLGEYLRSGNPDAPGHFIAWLVERAECHAEPLPGPWFDVGSLESLERARELFGR